MATTRKDIQERFHRAALDAYAEHGFSSYRDAEQKTGVNYSTVYAIVSRGRVPTRGQVIEWAEGLHEPINKWLDLAGYDPISQPLATDATDPLEAVQLALRDSKGMSESSKQYIYDMVRQVVARDRAEAEKHKGQ